MGFWTLSVELLLRAEAEPEPAAGSMGREGGTIPADKGMCIVAVAVTGAPIGARTGADMGSSLGTGGTDMTGAAIYCGVEGYEPVCAEEKDERDHAGSDADMGAEPCA